MERAKRNIKDLLSRGWNAVKLGRRVAAAACISSRFVPIQILGAMLSTWCTVIGIVWALVLWFWGASTPGNAALFHTVVQISIATFILCEVVCVVRKLSPIFSLRRKELSITWSQICILLTFLGWLIAVLIFTGLDQKNDFLTIAIIGTILGWIFQDTVKNIVAFLYLRFNNLIHIGDWIMVEARHIDGIVRAINLTTVTIENWDTTVTSFPIHTLYSDTFKNLQTMLDSKTHGRRMFMKFILDSEWVHPVTLDEARQIAGKIETDQYFKDVEVAGVIQDAYVNEKEVLNLALFRRYIHHWLMNNRNFSREPRLLVRFLEPNEFGIPLQIYGYIIEPTFESFEWIQSETVEHILQAMNWFNLRLYQSPSGFDASNSNIFISQQSAVYRNTP